MKDIKISGEKLRKELVIFVVCFVGSFGINIYSIFKFKTDWAELVSQLPIVMFISIIIYILVVIFRLIFIGIERLIKLK